MNFINFKNDAKYECLYVEEGSMNYDNATRRCLIVHLPEKEAGLDEINTLISDSANLSVIRHTNTEHPELVDAFENYSIKIELSLKPVSVGFSEDGYQTFENRIVFILGRKTPLELRVEELLRCNN